MTHLTRMAARSAWNRRYALALVALAIALSALLMLGIERVRKDVRQHFSESVSGTDLIVGARAGSMQLLLYSVFRIGSASNNISWKSAQALAAHPAVAWTVPISLGDSHRGFPVVATSGGYFEHFRYGDRRALELAQGRRFEAPFEAVLGAEVAEALGYRMDAALVLSHGDGALAENDHAEQPFRVVGILRRTGTPVDRSLHISLASMEALHREPMGYAIPGMPRPAAKADAGLEPRSVTAVLVGLKSRAAVFSVQRWVADYAGEPLQALLPGVALDELWSVIGLAERALLAMAMLVSLAGLAGMVAVILAGLDQRRRELAILRAVGASPRHVFALLALEGALVTLAGAALGALLAFAGSVLAAGWFQARFGIVLRPAVPGVVEWTMLTTLVAVGWLAALLPGYRAYRLSLADGLSPRT